MNGLTLSRTYFENTAREKLEEYFPDLYPHVAAGLVGNGSECFGFDDEVSRDHDWGVDFFLWVPESDRSRIPELVDWKKQLLAFFPPEYARSQSEYGAAINVMTCGDFYKQLIGVSDAPTDLIPWLRIPEENLAMCVNGEVFMDNAGEFSAIRQRLMKHYPEDIRKKKISAKCMAIAQTGQYNFKRMAGRGDIVTVNTVLARFIDSVTGIVFLLNRVYRPYYKWSYRMLCSLPTLGGEIGDALRNLILAKGFQETDMQKQQAIIDSICEAIRKELHVQGLSVSDDWFFTTQGEEVRARIQNDLLRSLPAQYE